MQRNHTVLTCVYGLFVVAMCCITYVAVYNSSFREPRIGSGAGVGIQNCLEILDSGSRFACPE